MKTLAVTGGIGSGKSHILKIFSTLGVPIYQADERTKSLYDSCPALVGSLTKILGKEVSDNGKILKTVMARKIFNDKSLLERVEKCVFPYVLEDFRKWRDSQEQSGTPFVILESAILLEKPLFGNIADKILTVSAPLELRISRVMRRDNVSVEQVMERIKNQWNDTQREKFADFVIYSDETKALLPQVLTIFKQLL